MLDEKEVAKNLTLTSPTIYEIIAEEGREEMERPTSSLLFSGIAAGLCISFSLYVMGYLSLMTDNNLIIAFGYCLGFLMVIKGRLQLFTENTITVILPLFNNFSFENLKETGRLWSIVFIANMIGTAFSALIMGPLAVATPEQLQAFLSISSTALDKTPMGRRHHRPLPWVWIYYPCDRRVCSYFCNLIYCGIFIANHS